MSVQERKLEIIERVLHIVSDKELDAIEQLLAELAVGIPSDNAIPPMPPRSAGEVEADFQQALLDAKEGRVYSHEQVVAMAQKWREKA